MRYKLTKFRKKYGDDSERSSRLTHKQFLTDVIFQGNMQTCQQQAQHCLTLHSSTACNQEDKYDIWSTHKNCANVHLILMKKYFSNASMLKKSTQGAGEYSKHAVVQNVEETL